MTLPPIFPSMCFGLFSCTEEKKLPLLPYNTIHTSPQYEEEGKESIFCAAIP